jgi:HNH endonuclease
MASAAPPHFVIKNRFQKGGNYRDLLTDEILEDICEKLTGSRAFTSEFDDNGYNKGRLAILEYRGRRNYISLSENEIRSRNSSFQIFPSALSRYTLDNRSNKTISFYILPNCTGNFETPYFVFMYRLMLTAGVNLINLSGRVSSPIQPFASPDDIIIHKERLRGRARGNKSTYVTRSVDDAVEIYGKTYGANKYETTLLCMALAKISSSAVRLYEVAEGGLTTLPQISRDAIQAVGVLMFSSNNTIELAAFDQNDSLRSIRFIYNLFEKFGKKKCAFCECEVSQIIQGAHIWPVASIKQANHLSLDEKLNSALDGHNGLWLCENHHKLLDSGTIYLSDSGIVKHKVALSDTDKTFIGTITTSRVLPSEYMHPDFVNYLNTRNQSIVDESAIYVEMAA